MPKERLFNIVSLVGVAFIPVLEGFFAILVVVVCVSGGRFFERVTIFAVLSNEFADYSQDAEPFAGVGGF